jgi:Ca-activated chloride channel family protein
MCSPKVVRYRYPPLISLPVLAFQFAAVVYCLGQQAKPDNSTVLLRVTATDNRGNPIRGLTKNQFSVFEGKQQVEITSFSDAAEPASLLFMFDVSGSISMKYKNSAAGFVYRLAVTSGRSNDYSVWAFNQKPRMICDWKCRGEDLKNALTFVYRIKPDTDTAFYDALDQAITHLESSTNQRQILIVFGDGQDTFSKTKFKTINERLKNSTLTVYSVRLIRQDGFFAGEGQRILDELSAVSGGKAFYPRTEKELGEILEYIQSEIEHQYAISFRIPAPRHDHKWHSIKLKVAPADQNVKSPKVYLRYREGYFDH